MEKTKNSKIAIAIVTILLLSSILAIQSLMTNSSVQAQTTNDLLQYDWPQGGSDEGNTGFSAGPGPSYANVLWKATGGSGMVSVFNGKAFCASGNTVRAWDALTGMSLYNASAPGTSSPTGVNAIHKLDETYFLTQGSGGWTVRRISDGALVWNATTPNNSRQPGSGQYFGGHYSTSMKMFFNHAYDPVTSEAQIVAVDLSDLTKQPEIAWKYVCDSPTELLCSGDGLVFGGTTEGKVFAVNMSGVRVWQSSTLGGIIQQSAMYYNHKLITSAVSWQITAFDGLTGERLWQAEKGTRAFSAYRGSAGNGMIFESTVELDPHGTIGAWDAETGERLWSQPGYFNIHYATMANSADGKVYGIGCDQAAGVRTGGLIFPGTETVCFDAYTGTQLWKLRGIGFSTPSLAYGNLYGVSGGTLYCIGGPAKDWNYGLHGNIESPRVAVGQQGPADISTPRWEFQTDGDVFSSPAIVDGRVYFGSTDHKIYCLNAYTGSKIWDFDTGFYVRSSVAVVGGRVYTGGESGKFYALNADTGAKIWETSAGGLFPNILAAPEAEPRSSPIVVGDKIYVGSLDNKLYCLSTADGRVQWSYATGGPIFGSPGYSNGVVFIASADSYLYAIDANTAAFKWKTFPLNMSVGVPGFSEHYNIGTPVIVNNTVFIGGGVMYGDAVPGVNYTAMGMNTPSGANAGGIRFFAFNEQTGASKWNETRAGNTQPLWIPAYWNNQIYAGEFFSVTSMNAWNPRSGTFRVPDFSATGKTQLLNRTFGQWLGYQIQSSVTYADDLTTPKIYVGSDIGSIYCLDATNLTRTLSVFTAGGNIPCSASIWEGKLYVGTTEGKLYCFDDSPSVDFSINAAADKGVEMWNNETITIGGRLTSNPKEMLWTPSLTVATEGVYVPVESAYHPGIPNATIIISVNKPDMNSVNYTGTTDKLGNFHVSFQPNTIGDWGWVAFYEGKVMSRLTYNAAFTEFNSFKVVSPTSQVTPPDGNENGTTQPGIPMEYVYAAIAVVAIAIIAIGAYVYTKKNKK